MNSFIIRICGRNISTDIGANPECLAECYERAVDKRLELIGLEDDAEAFQTLASAYGAFLSHYGIAVVTATHYEFQITKGN